MKLVDVMVRRRINILCLQEMKWTRENAKEIGNLGHKLWYMGWEKNRNGVGILVDKTVKDDVVEIKWIGDRIIMLKLVLENKFIYVISAYAPQIGLDAETKVKLWEDMNDLGPVHFADLSF